MSTDFFDDDLLKSSSRRKDAYTETSAVRPVSDEGLSRLSRQKEEVNSHVVDAVKEIEQLRLRQEQLEKEKKELQELGRRQEEYLANKRDIMEKLAQSIVVLEKEEMHAARMGEILAVMRTKFKDTLTEMKGIREETWSDDNYGMELNKAVVVVEDARSIFKKGLAKIEAAGMNANLSEMPLPSSSSITLGQKMDNAGFAYWLKVGLAVSLPLILFLVLLFAVWLYKMGY